MKTAVGEDQVAYLYEHQAEFPGVQIQQTYLRHYPHQAIAAQVLGYVREISQTELDAGRTLPLRRQDRQGRRRGEVRPVPPRPGGPGADPRRLARPPAEPARAQARRAPGSAVRLTIDIGLQRAAERALRYGIATARENEA